MRTRTPEKLEIREERAVMLRRFAEQRRTGPTAPIILQLLNHTSSTDTGAW